jgi:AcrR family transcriptional regulator
MNTMNMERKAIFDAALKLINAGKFQAVSLSEVGYYANLSERTTRYVFENKEKLIDDLSAEVLSMMHEVCSQSTGDWRRVENVFFDTWISLYEFYVNRPHVIAFVEQAGGLTIKHHENFMERLLAPLTKFFQTNKVEVTSILSPGSIAALFHGNAMAAAKLHGNRNLLPEQHELRCLAQILWAGLTAPALDKDESLLRIAN